MPNTKELSTANKDKKIFETSGLGVIYQGKIVAMKNGLVIGVADQDKITDLYTDLINAIDNGELPQSRFTILS